MNIKFFIPVFSAFSLLSSCLLGGPTDLLQDQDINKVMHQILSQHVGQGDMTKQLLKNSLVAYLDQFDPNRIYLLRNEVAPYTNISNSELTSILNQYKEGDYSIYKKLNETVVGSILRARKMRKELEMDPTHLLTEAKRIVKGGPGSDTTNVLFAKDLEELKKRIRMDMVSYTVDEMVRFGVAEVFDHPAQSLELYETSARAFENGYLFTDEAGNPLPFAQQRSVFVTHVLKSLSSTLDSHTKFYDKSEAYDMKVRLEKGFEGIGVRLQQKLEGIYVTGIIPGGPAAKSGLLKVNDQIVSVDGSSVKGKNFSAVLDDIRERNTPTIDFDVKRDNNPLHIQLKRDRITLNEGRVETNYEKFGNGIIGEITLHMFYQGENGVTSEADVKKAVADLSKIGNLRGLILDLRDNGGGFLSQAVQVASLFISRGVVVISKYGDGSEEIFRDLDGTEIYDGPLVILTSKETASAAEIVSQSLQDYGIALIVGDEQTYGKGTIQSQNITDQGDGTSPFKVTVGRYYTVSGKTPQLGGVKADIVVPSQFSFLAIGEEYLEHPLPSDSIAAEYKDDIEDVSASDKAWYLKNYLPNLQKKKDTWTKMLPELKKNSAVRIAKNEEYQKFLTYIKKRSEGIENGEAVLETNRPESFNDLQMQEAVNIVKDMIALQAKNRAEKASEEDVAK